MDNVMCKKSPNIMGKVMIMSGDSLLYLYTTITGNLTTQCCPEMVKGYLSRIPASGCGWPLFRKSLAGIRVSQRIPVAEILPAGEVLVPR
jgi:hypothetical protein